MKQSKPFTFYYPLKHKVVENLKIVTKHEGDLVVEGVGYFNPNVSVLDIDERYGVDIDFVKWNGNDIKKVLEVTGGMDEIYEDATKYFAKAFEETKDDLFEQMCETVRIANKIYLGL